MANGADPVLVFRLGYGVGGRLIRLVVSVRHVTDLGVRMQGKRLLLTVLLLLVWPSPGWGQNTSRSPTWNQPRQVNTRRASLAGIRKISGRHLTLFTDLPASPEVDRLPAVFDAAVPQWGEYFGIASGRLSDWRMLGFLVADRERFAQLGLLPVENRDFVNGYARGYELWLDEQLSDYYRRHLLLHEGTHGFMMTHLGGCGSGWYMEGMAELMATHTWSRLPDGTDRLLLRQMPKNRQEVPMWGRIKLVRDAYRLRETPSLAAVLQIDNRKKLDTAEYAWCWTLASMLDADPRFQQSFRRLQRYVTREKFNDHFRHEFRSLWPELTRQWASTVSTLEYGHDHVRMAIPPEPAVARVDKRVSMTIHTDRGWQSTGWLLEAGTTYQISARGRYQIARDSEPWHSEPGGITIEYHASRPLGILLAALVPPVRGAEMPSSSRRAHQDSQPPDLQPQDSQTHLSQSGLLEPMAVGLGETLVPRADGVLYLRVNDSSARLTDNKGRVVVAVEAR